MRFGKILYTVKINTMETSINHLQEMLNNKAEKSLKSDFDKLSEYYKNLPEPLKKLLGTINVNIGTSEKPQIQTLSTILYYSNLYESFKKSSIEEYIKEESKSFIKKVDSLQEQLSELQGEVENIRN